MLRLPRRRFAGGGSFNPRNDGPLIAGTSEEIGSRTSSENGAPARLGVAIGVIAAGAEGVGGTCPLGTAKGRAGTAGVSALTGGSACSSVAPHIPQKRLVAGLSLPQRGQRKRPPVRWCRCTYSLR